MNIVCCEKARLELRTKWGLALESHVQGHIRVSSAGDDRLTRRRKLKTMLIEVKCNAD